MAMEISIHKVVDEISFGLISPQDLRKQSVVEIQTPDTYDEDGAPITAGLMDGRLGTLEPRQRCKTCRNTAIRCPGHFGHIELAVPIVHIEFTKIIHGILKVTCRNCGRVLISEEKVKSIKKRIGRYRELLGTIPDAIYKTIMQEIKAKQCLVVGGGGVGTRKVKTLLECGAQVTVISPEASATLSAMAESGEITWHRRTYRSSDLDGKFLVIGATDDQAQNRKIHSDASQRNKLCNIADQPDKCNFILPAIVHRGDLILGISTSGKSPALAREIRQDLEQRFGMEYAHFLELMGAVRNRVLEESQDSRANKEKFDQLVKSSLLELVRRRDYEGVDRLLQTVLGSGYSLQELEITW